MTERTESIAELNVRAWLNITRDLTANDRRHFAAALRELAREIDADDPEWSPRWETALRAPRGTEETFTRGFDHGMTVEADIAEQTGARLVTVAEMIDRLGLECEEGCACRGRGPNDDLGAADRMSDAEVAEYRRSLTARGPEPTERAGRIADYVAELAASRDEEAEPFAGVAVEACMDCGHLHFNRDAGPDGEFAECGQCACQLGRTESATITVDAGEWLCACGNDASSDGFYPCDGAGADVEPTEADGWQYLYRCDRCGRIIHDRAAETVGAQIYDGAMPAEPAPVVVGAVVPWPPVAETEEG